MYDDKSYEYTVGTTRVYKIAEKNDSHFENELYCLDEEKSFPMPGSGSATSLLYINRGDFFDEHNAYVQSLRFSVYRADASQWNNNYAALQWLMKNMYLRNETPEQKDAYLEKAFGEFEVDGSRVDLDEVKALLTDDDIDVAQQYAIWHFTNGNRTEFGRTTLPAVTLKDLVSGTTGSIPNVKRRDYVNHLYEYLITTANSTHVDAKYPKLIGANGKTVINDAYYVAGPFKVESGNVLSSEYQLKVIDQNGTEIPRGQYEIKIDGESAFTDKNVNQILDKEYYIYLPKTNTTITKIKVSLKYKTYQTQASVFKTDERNEATSIEYQPVIWITRENAETNSGLEFNVIRFGSYSLELLKQDKLDTSVKLKDAEFSIQINGGTVNKYTTNDRGILTIDNIEITETGADIIKITETKAPTGYFPISGTLELRVNKTEVDEKYVASDMVISGAIADTTAVLDSGKIKVTVNDEKIDDDGKYEIKIVKQDKDDEDIKISGVSFDVQINEEAPAAYTTGLDGAFTTGTIRIKDDVPDRIKITEKTTPTGYKKNPGTLELEVEKDGALKIVKNVKTITPLTNATTSYRNGVITIVVNNEKIKGKYDLELLKVDSDTKAQLNGAKFSVKVGSNAARSYTVNGNLLIENIPITSVGEHQIEIRETQAPAGYNDVTGTIIINVTTELVGETYSVKEISTANASNVNVVGTYNSGKISLTVENVKTPPAPSISGNFNLRIEKRDKKTDSTIDTALFEVKMDSQDTEMYRTKNGIVYLPDIELRSAGKHKLKISETSAPYGYRGNDGIVELTLTVIESKGKYIISTMESGRADDVDAEAYYDSTTKTVVVIFRNPKIEKDPVDPEEPEGSYEFELVKVDQNGRVIPTNTTRFTINGKTKVTTDGIAKSDTYQITSDNVQLIDEYEIKETKAPTGYTQFDGTIQVKVRKMLSTFTDYYEIARAELKILDEEGNELKVLDKDGNEVPRGDTVEWRQEGEKTIITIYIVNYEKLDLSLRKFISAVSKDPTFEEEDYLKDGDSRVPVVDLTDLDNGNSTTAKYNHEKEHLKVEKLDYILYTIRVYNEGGVKATATQVVDYLPEGLEFVKDQEINDIWDYDETNRKLTTNEHYTPKLLAEHYKGRNLDFQDLEVVCRVKKDIAEDTNIVNIAEITESKYENGTIVEDRDSITNNLKYPDDLPGYNGGTDPDKEDLYIPGQEDDDDFERIWVDSIRGSYELDIVKIDRKGNVIKDLVTKFDINGEVKSTDQGFIKIPNITINKHNASIVDKYIIKETQAPSWYSKLDETIQVEVSKKLTDDEKKYVVNEVSMKVNGSTDSNKASVEVVEENGITKVVVKIINYEEVDLSLRKFISAVSADATFEPGEYLMDSKIRTPNVDIAQLDDGSSTTATYRHPKTAVSVQKGNYILYTIRVYNEGKNKAYATEVTDYLPQGLDFVDNVSINAIWKYDSGTRKLTTNENYRPILLAGHVEGKELSYQDLQVVCRVNDNVTEDKEIVNIAEITKITNEDGTNAKDRDSVPNNLNYPDDPSKYTGGKEDDEDYEKVIVNSKVIEGNYYIRIIKKDESDNTITDLTAKFDVNGSTISTQNGVATTSVIKINSRTVDEVDKFTIKEIQAPSGYKRYDGQLVLKVYKKLSNDEESFEIYNTQLEYINSNGEVYTPSPKVASAVFGKERDTGIVTIRFTNYKEEEKPKDPDKPDVPKNEVKNETRNEPANVPANVPSNNPKNESVVNNTVVNNVVANKVPVNNTVVTPKEEPKTEPEKPKKENPSTGDIIPVIAFGIIIVVSVINGVQYFVSKKRKKQD